MAMQSHYQNPVANHSFADPFVLKYCGEYWAYCTGHWPDGRWFGILRSRNLVDWEEVGGAVEPLPGTWPCVWAPEVNSHGGRFFLYYSCGDEATMQIRVAVAEHPAGPFRDSGRRLSAEPFAIDPHVFVDEDGAHHLFYATDYLDHSHVGTGTARDRLLDPFTAAGRPAPVTRARYDWQVYDPARVAKGGVRWHTIEGPFVLKRKGRYYQLFSGGNWQNPSYGVSYAVADSLDTTAEWEQVADGALVFPILRTVPGDVIGPGHNSAVRGPDNRELYCVYHSWAHDGSARLMSIDPMDWAGERIFLIGPSTGPRPLALPTHADYFDGHGTALGPAWSCAGGAWSAGAGRATQGAAVAAAATFQHTPAAYLAELSLAANDPAAPGGYGVALGDELQILLEPAAGRAVARVRRGEGWEEQAQPLPHDFAPMAFHLLRLEVDGRRVVASLDGSVARWTLVLPSGPGPLVLVTTGAPASFAGFALTEGWEDCFERAGRPEDYGWRAGPAGTEPGPWCEVGGGALHIAPVPDARPLLKGPLPAAYELAVNLALLGAIAPAGAAVVYPAAGPASLGPALALRGGPEGWRLSFAGEELPLPAGFDGSRPHQLRVRVADGVMAITHEGASLGEWPAPAGSTQIGLAAEGAAVAFELIRVTALPSRPV